jgi:hypothetical protein
MFRNTTSSGRDLADTGARSSGASAFMAPRAPDSDSCRRLAFRCGLCFFFFFSFSVSRTRLRAPRSGLSEPRPSCRTEARAVPDAPWTRARCRTPSRSSPWTLCAPACRT